MLIQSVPNFSEGRKKEIVEELASLFKELDVQLIDYSLDKDHNRSVFTLLGRPEPLKDAILKGVGRARDLINMEEHEGGHPRIGATDVVPFIPIKDVTMEECVDIAKEVAEAIYRDYSIPTYLYGYAAQSKERENISWIRRGQYEGLKESIQEEERRPDFGAALHPTAGATIVGARMPLIAFNVNLSTKDMNVAHSIARSVRESGGGLVNIKAMGVSMEATQQAQISMNVENYSKTPMHRVFELIKIEAKRYGVTIAHSQVVGLLPMEALTQSAAYYLQIQGLEDKQILENHLLGGIDG